MEDTRYLEMKRLQQARRKRRRRIKIIKRNLLCLVILSFMIFIFVSVVQITGNLFFERFNYEKTDNYTEPQENNEGLQEDNTILQGNNEELENEIRNLTIILDAGHGGIDVGTIVETIEEKNINIQVTNKLKEILEDKGIDVILTRENDETIKLDERISIANQYDADLFISIHCNFYEKDDSIRGLEAYYYNNEKAKYYADIMLEDLSRTEYIKTRNVKSVGYYVLKYSKTPAILLELGFLSNEQERINLSDDEYQDYLANALALSIMKALLQE